tara:strand:+ start:110 stop:730 length:621 start_codon:yes stop_codon:yes gene_type:complete
MKWSLISFFILNYIFAAINNQSWSSLNFKIDAPFSTKLNIEQSLRLENNLSQFKQTFTEISISYKINDLMRIDIPYRYSIYKNKIKNRISIGSSIKLNKKKIGTKYRLKFQNIKESDKPIEITFRNKFTISYKVKKKIEPFIAYEIFNPYENRIRGIDETRISLGSQIKINKKRYIKFYYIHKKEDLLKAKNNSLYILGLDYSLSF